MVKGSSALWLCLSGVLGHTVNYNQVESISPATTMENLFLHVDIRGKRPFPRIVSEAVKITFSPISPLAWTFTLLTASNLQPCCQRWRHSGDDSASCLPACIHCTRKPQRDTPEGPSRRRMGVLCAFCLNLNNLFCSEWSLKGCYVISTHSHSYVNVTSLVAKSIFASLDYWFAAFWWEGWHLIH